MSGRRLLLFIALAAFVAGVMFAGGAMLVKELAPPQPPLADHTAGANAVVSGGDSVADIVDKVSPAVVKIDTRVTKTFSGNPFLNDPFFRQFFGPSAPLQQQEEHGMGSGFIFSPDGYILTNEHVIQGATDVTVTLAGSRKPLPAKVIGADHDLDLAVVKIDGHGLPTLKIGDSNRTRVGDLVIAIGNPYGLDHTVTTGVISAKGRPITIEDRYYDNLLQTDASINPGNSGGPLLNMQGEVIGVNTAVNTQAQGIGFAIPTSTIRPVLDELIRTGKITHPWLGVQMQELTPEVAQYAGLPDTQGVLVIAVVPHSPAARAGIKPGDILLTLDGNKISGPQHLGNLVRSRKAGDKAKIVIRRDGRDITVQATLERRPSK
ncbi:MAG: trypsin-like peptidase domain-containing protein [Bacillota bacterium]|nr:trypsin-like peptidase domain-containing protein [Bacillota bacterium]